MHTALLMIHICPPFLYFIFGLWRMCLALAYRLANALNKMRQLQPYTAARWPEKWPSRSDL